MTERVKKTVRDATDRCRSGEGAIVLELDRDWIDSGDLEELHSTFRSMGYGCEAVYPTEGAIAVQVYPNGLA